MASGNATFDTAVQGGAGNSTTISSSTGLLESSPAGAELARETPSTKSVSEEPQSSTEDASPAQAKPLTPNPPEFSVPLPATPQGEEEPPESRSTPIPEAEPAPAPLPPQPPVHLHVPQTHQTYITFLFLSGRRRLMNFEPDTTIGRVKELVWGAWDATTSSSASPNVEGTSLGGQLNQDQTQPEERPPAPSYLRVLYLGRMLQDDETLRDLKLLTHLSASTSEGQGQNSPVSTIMHLSVRPFPPPGDPDTGKKTGRGFGRDAAEPGEGANTGCCGCVIC